MKCKVKKLISIVLSMALVMTSVLVQEIHSQAAKGPIENDSVERGTYGDEKTINYLYYRDNGALVHESFLILDGTGVMPDISSYDDVEDEDDLYDGYAKFLYDMQGWYGASLAERHTEEATAAYGHDNWKSLGTGLEIDEILVGGEISNIGAYTFLDVQSPDTIRLGKNVTTIGKWAFAEGIHYIKSFYIYGEIESIGEMAFDWVSTCQFYVASQKTAAALVSAGIKEANIHTDLTMDDTPLRIALKKCFVEQKEHPDGEGYTIGSWKELTSKMEEGQELLDAIDEGTAETTETEINDKAAAIETAISGLLSSKVLDEAIAKAEKLTADDYTADSWAVLQEAVGAGKAGMNTAKTQDDIDELVSAIEEAIEALEDYVESTPTPEPTAVPTAEPTAKPTAEPTAKPTAEPTAKPTAGPTAKPTAGPTAKPTATPTAQPTVTAAPAKIGAKLTSGNFVYKVTKTATAKTSGALTVTALSKAGKKAGKLSVLATATIDGYTYKVTKLGSNALKDAAAKSVTLGKNITAIPKGAFSGCKKLSTLTVNAKLKSVKKGAFKGCKKKIKVKGGDKKTRKGNIAKLKKSGYKKFK